MKKYLSFFLIFLLALTALSGCGGAGGGKSEATTEDEESQQIEAKGPYKKEISMILENYDERTFPEDLDLSLHRDLLDGKEISGPFLKITDSEDYPLIPNDIDNYITDNPKIYEGYEFKPADEDDFPEEYVSLLKEKGEGSQEKVFALLEYLGYESAGNYNGGTFILYNHVTRVSFYSAEDGTMLAWMKTNKYRRGPMVLGREDYASDRNHAILTFDAGSIWSATSWTNAFDELFYDENGYQVVGDRLLSVPEGLDVIKVPDGVKRIEKYACKSDNAVEVILPDGLEKIGYKAFAESEIAKVNIPDSVRYIDEYAFDMTPWLEEQMKKKDYLIVGDGILLACGDQSKEIVLPSEVKYIAPNAISSLPCRKLTIPSTVIQCMGSARENSLESPIHNCQELEELILAGGLQQKQEDVPLAVVYVAPGLKLVEIKGPCDALPENWIYDTEEVLQGMTLICPDDSPAAQWADSRGIEHKSKR